MAKTPQRLGLSGVSKKRESASLALHMVEQFRERNNFSLSKNEYWLRVFAYALLTDASSSKSTIRN